MDGQRVAWLRVFNGEGPVTGLTNGSWHTTNGRSSAVRASPPKQSSVPTSSSWPGRIQASGSRPPNE
jgi:hypothetical protein